METSGEIGERESRLSVVTIVLHDFALHIDGDANEDFVSKVGPIRVHSEPLFNRDCTVEAG